MWLLCVSTVIQCARFMLSILVLKLFSWKFVALFLEWIFSFIGMPDDCCGWFPHRLEIIVLHFKLASHDQFA